MLTAGSAQSDGRATCDGASEPDGPRWRLNAFGLGIEADFPIAGATDQPVGAAADTGLTLRRASRAELEPLAAQARMLRYLQTFDGCHYAMLEGGSGDVLFDYGPRALFHLTDDGLLLRCAAADEPDRSWERVLLDTVLWTASLLRGFELMHASAVATTAGVVAFAARSGGGKSSLAAEFIRRGGRLFCDDIIALDDAHSDVVAHPGPPLMNLPRTESLEHAEVIARFGDEQWVRVRSASHSVQRIAAVVLIDRRKAAPTCCSAIDATSLTLLPHAIGFPHLDARARRRFELFGALAATARVVQLSADPDVPTAELADLVESRIGLR